jgi:hypothetical protein
MGAPSRYVESHLAAHEEKRETDGSRAVTDSLTPSDVQVARATNAACCLNCQGGDQGERRPSTSGDISMIFLDNLVLKFLSQVATQFNG